jgi:2'-hydroxyisoflavone reductase
MDILILGGTIFLGKHLVEAALDRGHTVTLFNRERRGK